MPSTIVKWQNFWDIIENNGLSLSDDEVSTLFYQMVQELDYDELQTVCMMVCSNNLYTHFSQYRGEMGRV